jgi:hypothetical protein
MRTAGSASSTERSSPGRKDRVPSPNGDYTTVDHDGSPTANTLLPRSGHPSLKLQGVQGPGGVHLDLEVNDVPAAIDVARGVGATVVSQHPDWAVMRSPGGQLFCLTPWE